MICNFFNKVRFLTNKLKLLIFMKKPFLHLHLSLLFLMGCVFLLPSCIEDKAEDAAHRLVVSKVDVELIQTGMLNTGSKASFDVLANRGYVITSDAEWLDVDKPTGKGRVSVTLEAKPNETAGERTGHLTVTSGKLSERVTVTQTLDPDPDDGNPVGYTYYSENFDWIAVYGGADCVGLGSQNGAKNIYSTGDALQKFGEAGLQDYNPVGKTMYACAGYFKMGATDKQTGIILPALKIGRKKASNVELTFETCPNIGGSGKADAVTVTVEIVEGPGTVNGNSDRESEAMKPDQTWKWTPMSVKLYGVTAATRIAIRSHVYRNNIPSKKEHGQIFYSKLHFDLSKQTAEDDSSEYYTVQEAMKKYNLTRDSVYGILQFHEIKREKKGRFVRFLKVEFDHIMGAR